MMLESYFWHGGQKMMVKTDAASKENQM